MDKAGKVHFIGIGGAGMSGLAEVFHGRGYRVQGSDIKKTKVTDRLESLGIKVGFTHSAGNVEGADYVVYSTCIKEDNAEFREAMLRDIPLMRRMEALRLLTKDEDIIAVSGAHGKTTTTALISFLLIEAGLDPTVFIGADVFFLNGNARCGRGNMVVTEADESDGSFLLLKALYSVTTNLDREHMDYYSSMDKLRSSYRKFIENTREDGCAFVCAEDEDLIRIARESSKRIMKFGFSQDADVRACDIQLLGLNGSRFEVAFKGKMLGKVSVPLTGIHNILNTLAAIGIALNSGLDFSLIAKSIPGFKGIERRFIVTRLEQDILLIDDYAHHPAEIRATLKGLEGSGRRVVVVFQPHRYSRTEDLKEEFGRSFDSADHVIITDIYSAHEKIMDDVKAEDICECAKKHGHKNIHFVPKHDIIKEVTDIVRPGDAVFILGAGDIGEMPPAIIQAISRRPAKVHPADWKRGPNRE